MCDPAGTQFSAAIRIQRNDQSFEQRRLNAAEIVKLFIRTRQEHRIASVQAQTTRTEFSRGSVALMCRQRTAHHLPYTIQVTRFVGSQNAQHGTACMRKLVDEFHCHPDSLRVAGFRVDATDPSRPLRARESSSYAVSLRALDASMASYQCAGARRIVTSDRSLSSALSLAAYDGVGSEFLQFTAANTVACNFLTA